MVTYKQKTDDTFTNPYHFIPLGDECIKKINYQKHRSQKDLKTGWIECTLKTLTPTFIPSTSNDDFFGVEDENDQTRQEEKTIKSYDFFSYPDNSNNSEETTHPVIPGSSIRGPIRSLFETLTNSCMSTTDTNQALYKRTPKPAKKCGRLVKNSGKWQIEPCEKYMIKIGTCTADPAPMFVLNRYSDGDAIFFQQGSKYNNIDCMPKTISEISTKATAICKTQGYLHLGEPFGSRKHHESVFVPTTKNPKAISKEAVENLLENYKLYQDGTVNLHKKKKKHDGYKSNIKDAEHKKIDELHGCLVYYSEVDSKIYLSPAAIGREVFYNCLKDIIGSYCPCTSSDELCPACALFGFAGNESKEAGKNKNAIASRVRFSDAKLTSDEKVSFHCPVILPELASPKPSATEFYLKKPGAPQNGKTPKITQWNYDYYEYEDNKQDAKKYSPKIQGRKFYWHHHAMKTFDSENNDRNFRKKIKYSDRLVKVRPVCKDNEFTFKVHFNQITQDELEKLLWVLALGNNKDLAHKIGMGKPVGLGSVQISIDAVKERVLSLSNEEFSYTIKYIKLPDWNQVEPRFKEETLSAVKKILDFNSKPDNINYPYCVDKNDEVIPENYEWFVGNKQTGKKASGINPIVSQHLGDINNPSLTVIKRQD